MTTTTALLDRSRAVAFNRRCTHAACSIVDSAEPDRMTCPCHGSAFRLVDGAVLQGPAVRPLEATAVVEEQGSIYLA